MPAPAEPARRNPRFWWLDAARGAALVAMASYHLIWDLELFGYLEAGTANTGLPRIYARFIAATFLFLAGFALALAHRNGFKIRPFSFRLAKVAAAAALVSLATWFAMPQSVIFFGILHHIAVAGVIGLAFVGWPALPVAAAAALAFGLPLVAPHTVAPVLDFLGFSESPAISNDFVPLFPWLSASLAGIAAARLLIMRDAWPAWPARFHALGWLGRHSLPFYLLHQPVLIALVWSVTQLAPPSRPPFADQCMAACEQSFGVIACKRYCECFETQLISAGVDPQAMPQTQSGLETIITQCSAEMRQP